VTLLFVTVLNIDRFLDCSVRSKASFWVMETGDWIGIQCFQHTLDVYASFWWVGHIPHQVSC